MTSNAERIERLREDAPVTFDVDGERTTRIVYKADVAALLAEYDEQRRKIDAVRAYAEDRSWYGQRNRTVGSSRIASDLLTILNSAALTTPINPKGATS